MWEMILYLKEMRYEENWFEAFRGELYFAGAAASEFPMTEGRLYYY